MYHLRQVSEHKALHERINAALRHNEDRLEVVMVRRMLADVHRDEGRDEGRKEGRDEGRKEGRDEGHKEGQLAANKRTLMELLRLRFETLPPVIEQTIETTQDATRLTKWLHGVITAKDLDSIGIGS